MSALYSKPVYNAVFYAVYPFGMAYGIWLTFRRVLAVHRLYRTARALELAGRK